MPDSAPDSPYFTRPDASCLQGPGGLPVVEIHNAYGEARISLLGANLIGWTPRDAEAVIWLSDAARFEAGKSIRGGVPVCWPWFGAHPAETGFPAHGFARTRLWQVDAVETLEHGETRVGFSLPPDAETRHYWPHHTRLEYQVTLGRSLQLELITSNLDAKRIELSQALHTYFRVGDVSRVTLHGLEGKNYLDKPDGFKQKQQTGPITINREVDRIYLDTRDDCIIEDPLLERNIRIKKSGSASTVVWNPWQAVAEKMGDLGENGYLNMLCVESSNAASDSVILEAGAQHRLRVEYSVES